MTRICRQCRRANPGEAAYCYFDGVFLDGRAGGDAASSQAINIGAMPFTVPFVLPSGRSCRSFNELAQGCLQDPAAALSVLRKGYLEAFLAGQGRSDLAGAARAAARAADLERGLDELLGRLPASGLRPARLRVEPSVLDLGTVRVGEDRRLELVLHNDGTRLLYGSASCADDPWLSLGDGKLLQRKLFQFSGRTTLPLHILGRRLRAYRKPQETEVRLESNGGTVTVVVRVQVPVQPFPEGVLAGALSPRQVAEKARDAPKESAALIENGAIARWYTANGWVYPVKGPTASGMAAVQQLFEALGLAKAPQVELSEEVVVLSGFPGQKIDYVLAVLTQENRAAVAHGASDKPWLQVGPTVFRGRTAALPLIVPSVPGRPGDTLEAAVSVTANGNQRFVVPVTLTVAAPPVPAGNALRGVPLAAAGNAAAGNAVAGNATEGVPYRAAAPREDKPRPTPEPVAVPPPIKAARPAPVAPKVPAPVPGPAGPPLPRPSAKETSAERSPLLTFLPAGLLVVLLMGVTVRDYLVPAPQQKLPENKVVDAVPRLEIRFHDVKQNDELEKLWLPGPQPTMRFGLVMLHKGKEVGQGVNVRRLTFDPWGRTNNTCLRFDGKDERLFGSTGGRFEVIASRTWEDDKGQKHQGAKSVWICDDRKIAVTQFVELVRGDQSELLDTCRVRYLVENRDNKAHQVGIRFLLDSFIGGNDGVPFTIPGESDLCDTMKDLPSQAKDKKIPDFLQALEKPDLGHPGTIAHLRLKLEDLEPPARVTLGAWPNEKLRVLVRKNDDGPTTLWDVPVLPMKALDLNDSAIAIYWKEEPLLPGGKREVGFEYGLWNLASQGSQLAATVDGAFRPDGELTVIAYVNRPPQATADAAVTLTLPEGFTLLQGAPTQVVPRLPKDVRSDNYPVTWKVKAGPTGKHEMKVKSSAGPEQTLPLEIKKSIF